MHFQSLLRFLETCFSYLLVFFKFMGIHPFCFTLI